MKKMLLLMMGLLVFMGMNAQTYPVNLNVGSNGIASLDKQNAAIGETVTITVSPSQFYEVDEVKVQAKYEPDGGSGGALAPRRIKIFQGSRLDSCIYRKGSCHSVAFSKSGVFHFLVSYQYQNSQTLKHV